MWLAVCLTLTFDRGQFAGPGEAFKVGRNHIRQMMYSLRRGVFWEGKFVKIDAPYCVKVEFHQDGWAHFHLVLLTRRHLPGGLLNQVLGFGRCNVKRIGNQEFRYLLKYVTKGGGSELPEWVLGMKRLRIWQTTKGFLLPDPKEAVDAPEASVEAAEDKQKDAEIQRTRKKDALTIAERLEKWARMAVLVRGASFQRLRLRLPFRAIFDHLVLSVARDGRYLDNGHIRISQHWQLLPWTSHQLQKLKDIQIPPTPPPWEMACS